MGGNAELINRFYDEIIGSGNVDLIDELASDDIVDHEEGFPGQPPGKEGVKFFVNTMRQAFPDIKATVDVTLDQGELAAGRTILRGTHQGEFMGVPASNKSIEVETIDIIRVVDGRVAEHWGVTDTMTLMQQIGAIPE
jgi:steroid delta-isomerase-like uncharacterized protein